MTIEQNNLETTAPKKKGFSSQIPGIIVFIAVMLAAYAYHAGFEDMTHGIGLLLIGPVLFT